jgi:outer membrane immunogenic protein
MLKFALLTSVALLAAGSASAQDATSAPAATDAPSWTGPYIGIHGGYGFDAGQKVSDAGNSANNNAALASGLRPYSLNQNRAGWLGGGQIGYNLQRGNLVFGGEGDFSYMHSRGDSDYYGTDTRRTHLQSDLDWMGTARLRAGYATDNGTGFFYGTGGYAFGRVKGSANFYALDGQTVNYAGSHAYTAQGWTAGLGAEFRPFAAQGGSMSRVSFRLESNYYDLGRSHIQAGQTATQPGYYTLGVDTKGYNARFGINYSF